jgi:hypothetical protein
VLLDCRHQACVLCLVTYALFAACLMATHLAWMAASASGLMGMSWLVPCGVPQAKGMHDVVSDQARATKVGLLAHAHTQTYLRSHQAQCMYTTTAVCQQHTPGCNTAPGSLSSVKDRTLPHKPFTVMSCTHRVAVPPDVQHKAPQQLWVQAARQLACAQRLQAGCQLGVVNQLAAQLVSTVLQVPTRIWGSERYFSCVLVWPGSNPASALHP